MRIKSSLLLVLLLIFAAGSAVASSLEITGSFDSTITSTTTDPYYLQSSSDLVLDLDKNLGNAAVHARLKGQSSLPVSSDEFNLDLDEAYVDYYGSDFDLRFGKQRVSWGSAMQINPADVINPINLEDPLGDKQAILAGGLDYYLGNSLKLSAVWVPFFEPAVKQLQHPVSGELIQVPQGEAILEESEYALRLSATGVKGFDLAAGYFNGKEDAPNLIVENGLPKPIYRDVQIYSADMATTIRDFGLWAEGAYIVPEEGDPYNHWIVGGDYGFQNGLILVGQYYHRDDDRGEASYVIVGAEKDFASIHGGRLGLLYNIDNQSYMLSPEVSLSLADATNLVIGANYFPDDEASLELPFLAEESRLYAKVEVSF